MIHFIFPRITTPPPIHPTQHLKLSQKFFRPSISLTLPTIPNNTHPSFEIKRKRKRPNLSFVSKFHCIVGQRPHYFALAQWTHGTSAMLELRCDGPLCGFLWQISCLHGSTWTNTSATTHRGRARRRVPSHTHARRHETAIVLSIIDRRHLCRR